MSILNSKPFLIFVPPDGTLSYPDCRISERKLCVHYITEYSVNGINKLKKIEFLLFYEKSRFKVYDIHLYVVNETTGIFRQTFDLLKDETEKEIKNY